MSVYGLSRPSLLMESADSMIWERESLLIYYMHVHACSLLSFNDAGGVEAPISPQSS